MLSIGPGGILAGTRACLWGGGSQWLVRGHPWQIGPAWIDGVLFPGALRVRGSGRLAGRSGPAAELRCGLCGGWPDGDVAAWAGAHPMALAGRVKP